MSGARIETLAIAHVRAERQCRPAHMSGARIETIKFDDRNQVARLRNSTPMTEHLFLDCRWVEPKP
jgi:hypothetical protein